MALYLFTKSIIEEKPIEIFNYGKMMRDFTFIDDIIESIVRLCATLPNKKFNYLNPDPSSVGALTAFLILGIPVLLN